MTGNLQLEDAESLFRAALIQCRPLVRTEWEQFEDRDGLAVAIQVARSTELHSLADGRVLVRTHAGNEPLDGAKISHLAATKASGDFEMETVRGPAVRIWTTKSSPTTSSAAPPGWAATCA